MRKKTYLRLKGTLGLGVCLLAVSAGGHQVHAENAVEEIVLAEQELLNGGTESGNRELEQEVSLYDKVTGYVEVPYVIHSIEENDSDEKEIEIHGDTEIPAYYDAREHGRVTAVKRQNPWGNCWSFAAISALESSLISDGYSQDIDLSEYHLCYYNYKAITDPLNGTEGDGFTYTGTFEEFLDAGGNILVSYHALTNWVGAVEETVTGYPTEEGTELEASVEGAYLNDKVHLQQMYQISTEDTDAVKREIMEHGGLTASFYYKSTYYNSSTGGYYNNVNTSSNHAVAVVGWDDNFSKENFKTQPSADGAWLVKNSWGTSFGQEGYQWISYEDTSLGDVMCLLLAEDADNYDNNYQYDGSYMNTSLKIENTVMASNIFRIQEGEAREELRAVAFELGNTNVDYSIQIYGNLRDENNPLSGKALLEEPVTGSTTYQGYYTVELPETVYLNPGENFAVVITYEKDGSVYVTLEKSTVWNNIEFVASAKEKQSYLSTNGGTTWMDVGKKYAGNIRIKAFTDNTEVDPIQLVEEVTVTPDSLECMVGENKQLQVTVAPEDAEDKTVIWSSSDETVATVDQEGNVTAHGGGTANIICTSTDGGASASVEVIVHDIVTLEPAETELTVGERAQLKLLVNGVEEKISLGEGAEWTVTIVDSNQVLDTIMTMVSEMDATVMSSDVVTISEDGILTGTAMGSCTISFTNKADVKENATATVGIRTPFKDIRTTDWQYPFVVNMYEQRYMVGITEDLFGTDTLLSRSQFVTILYAFSGKPECEYRDNFSDVAEDDWFALPVTWAVEKGITAGYAGGNFGSDDSITREQLVLMLYRYAESLGYDMSATEGNLEQYPDALEVSDYAVEAMNWAVANGMISGRGELLVPSGETSRGECATIITRFVEMNGMQTEE